MEPRDVLIIVPLGLVLVAASVADLRTRRIPNVLTFGAAALAVAFHAASGGWREAAWSGGGLFVGFAAFLPLFLLRGMGAGDVKLLAAVGAWLGPAGANWTALYAAIAGGAMAVVLALSRGYLGTAFTNLWSLAGYWRVVGPRPYDGLTLQSAAGPRLPYALAIAAGAVVTIWLR
jgi:prepilin peptidase CpaA